MPITAPIDTPSRAGDIVALTVAAATSLFAGGLAARNAAGDIVAAADTANLEVLGRIEEDVDNSAGSAGDLTVNIRKDVFRYANSGDNALSKAHVGNRCYVEDDATVASDPGDNNIVAGEVVAVDDDGVWVDTRKAPVLQLAEALEIRIAALEAV